MTPRIDSKEYKDMVTREAETIVKFAVRFVALLLPIALLINFLGL
jgi:hypothetical protein